MICEVCGRQMNLAMKGHCDKCFKPDTKILEKQSEDAWVSDDSLGFEEDDIPTDEVPRE